MDRVDTENPTFYSHKNKKSILDEQWKLDNQYITDDEKYNGFAYKYDKNDNTTFRVNSLDKSKITVTYDQALEKYHHHDISNIKKPKNFNSAYSWSLNPRKRSKYVAERVPRHKIIEYQIEIAKSLTTQKFIKTPECVGRRRDGGNLFINVDTGQLHFVNEVTNEWRTSVVKRKAGLLKLTETNFQFYSFPNAGK